MHTHISHKCKDKELIKPKATIAPFISNQVKIKTFLYASFPTLNSQIYLKVVTEVKQFASKNTF